MAVCYLYTVEHEVKAWTLTASSHVDKVDEMLFELQESPFNNLALSVPISELCSMQHLKRHLAPTRPTS